jgi:hypothetical protein
MSSVSLKHGLHGIQVAVVEPPYELLGEFLTAEGSSVDSWACDDLLSVVRQIKRGEITTFQKAGDAHTVHMTPESVRIVPQYRIPPTETTVPLDTFGAIIEQWKGLITRNRQ